MSKINSWAEAIAYECGVDGQPSLATVLGHIRSAIAEADLITRGRITRGLKEAYRPLDIDEFALGAKIDEAIQLLCLSGDVDEFSTRAGRGYAATPPRLVDWGSDQVAVLGATTTAASHAIVRRISATETDATIITVPLQDELGRPEWRSALVELGAADAPGDNSAVLFNMAQTLAASGDRYSLDEPLAVAVVSGRGEFFGRADNAPSGRWKRVDGDGCFAAAIQSGFTTRHVVLSISGRAATLWQPPTIDMWRWIVVGATLAAGHSVLRYEVPTGKLDFLTPPPLQAERAALLTGSQIGPWSWKIDHNAYGALVKLIGSSA